MVVFLQTVYFHLRFIWERDYFLHIRSQGETLRKMTIFSHFFLSDLGFKGTVVKCEYGWTIIKSTLYLFSVNIFLFDLIFVVFAFDLVLQFYLRIWLTFGNARIMSSSYKRTQSQFFRVIRWFLNLLFWKNSQVGVWKHF